MRILHYFPTLRPTGGGVPSAVISLVHALRQTGHGVSLIGVDGDTAERATLIAGPTAGLVFTGKSAATLDAAIADAEVVHLHGLLAVGNWWVARRARRMGRPYVLSLHGQLSPWSMQQKGMKKAIFMRVAGNRLLREASVIHVTAPAELDSVESRLPPDPSVAIAPPVVDLDRFRAATNTGAGTSPDSEPLELLFLSRVHHTKSPEVAIDALAVLTEFGIACRLTVAGPGDADYLSSLQDRVARLGLTSSVTFVGEVDDDRKVDLYQRATVFVLPTQHENFGLVLIEALSSGTPVITTTGAGIWRELEASGGASIVERDAAAFAEAVRRLLTDPQETRSMGSRGRQWALSEFEASSCLARFESIYADAAAT